MKSVSEHNGRLSKRFCSIIEAEELLGVKAKTLYAWASKGIIPSYRFGRLVRFRMDELLKWVDNQRAEQPQKVFYPYPQTGDIDSIIEQARDSVLFSSQGKARPASDEGGD